MKSKKMYALAIIISLLLCGESIISGHEALILKSPNVIESSPNYAFAYIRRGFEYTILNIIYIYWLIRVFKQPVFYKFSWILKTSLLFLLFAFLAFPETSDIFLYLHYGEMDLNGINPFINRAGDFSSQLLSFLSWNATSAYGPISQILFIVPAYFLSLNVLAGLYIFKTFCLTAHLINAYAIWRNLKISPYRAIVTVAYILNPLLLYEQISNAHIDVFICTSLILLITCLQRHRYVASILMIWIGFLIKTLPIIFLPLVLTLIIRRKLWKSLIISCFLSLVIIIILHSTTFTTNKAWISVLNPGVTWAAAGSLHQLFNVLVDGFLDKFLPHPANHPHRFAHIITQGYKMLTYFAFVLYATYILAKTYFKQGYSENDLILDFGWILLFLFLLATPWYQPWYSSILLPIVALRFQSRLFVLASLTFSILSSTSYYLLGYGTELTPYLIISIITDVPTLVILLFKQKTFRLSS